MTKKEALVALWKLLVELFPDKAQANRLAEQSGVAPQQVDPGGSSADYWWRVLVAAHARGKVQEIVKNASWEVEERAADLKAGYKVYADAPDTGEPLDEPSSAGASAAQASNKIDTGGGAYIGGNVSAGGDFVGRDKFTYGDEVKGDKVSGVKIGNVEGGIHGSTIAGGNVSNVQSGNTTTFDQRGQTVEYQYNSAGDINFAAVQDRAALIEQLEKLQGEIAKALAAQALDEDAATDADYNIKKAAQQAKKPDADGKSIGHYLTQAKNIVERAAVGAAAAGGLVTALTQAIDVVQRLF